MIALKALCRIGPGSLDIEFLRPPGPLQEARRAFPQRILRMRTGEPVPRLVMQQRRTAGQPCAAGDVMARTNPFPGSH